MSLSLRQLTERTCEACQLREDCEIPPHPFGKVVIDSENPPGIFQTLFMTEDREARAYAMLTPEEIRLSYARLQDFRDREHRAYFREWLKKNDPKLSAELEALDGYFK